MPVRAINNRGLCEVFARPAWRTDARVLPSDAPEELPEVEYTRPDGPTRSTRSLSKQPPENGEEIEDGFAEKP